MTIIHIKLIKDISLGLALGCLLSACGGPDVVVTTDDSANYKSAKTLPPLKKPSQPPTEPVQTQESVDTVELEQAMPVGEQNSVLAPEVQSAEVAEALQHEQAEALQHEQAEALQHEQAEALQYEQAEALQYEQAEALQYGGIAATIINPNEGVARLQIEASFDNAWKYLADHILKSDITLHRRNKAAGVFSVGCAGISELNSEPVEVVKKGSWSFLNKKQTDSEYCALQMVRAKNTTLVSVVNQSGEEIEGLAASTIFNRIINN